MKVAPELIRVDGHRDPMFAEWIYEIRLAGAVNGEVRIVNLNDTMLKVELHNGDMEVGALFVRIAESTRAAMKRATEGPFEPYRDEEEPNDGEHGDESAYQARGDRSEADANAPVSTV
jgi:hypothetical protein